MRLSDLNRPQFLRGMPPGETARIAAHPRGRNCGRCGRYHDYFDVPDSSWRRVPPRWRAEHLCLGCFRGLTGLVDVVPTHWARDADKSWYTR